MGLLPYIEEEMKQQGVDLRLKNIPREVCDKQAVEKTLRKGSSKVTIENGQIIKIEMDDKGITRRETLTQKWSDWIDYWAKIPCR